MYRLVLLVSALAAASALEFDCTTLVPIGRSKGEAEHTAPFGMMMDVSKKYKPGDKVAEEKSVTVTIQSHTQSFNKFMVQARRPQEDVAVGTFSISTQDQVSKLSSCVHEADTITHKDKTFHNKVTFIWQVPSDLTNAPEIEFDVVIGHNRKFWIFNTMMILIEEPPKARQHPTEEEERARGQVHIPDDDVTQEEPQTSTKEDDSTGEDPNEPKRRAEQEKDDADRRDHVNPNMHDAKTEQELAQQEQEDRKKEMDDEDKYSEGEWQKMEQEARKQHQREMQEEEVEYERLQAEEEHERQRRIQFEIRDKEEHDKQAHKVQGPLREGLGDEIDMEGVDNKLEGSRDTSSGVRLYFSTISLLLTAFILFI